MPPPPLSELEASARKIVWQAKKKGTLKEHTTGIVKRLLEKQYELSDGFLNGPSYKYAIKEAVKAAVDEESPSSDEEEEKVSSKNDEPLNKKRKSDGKLKDEGEDEDEKPTPTRKAKGKTKATAKKVEDDEDNEGSVKKKRKTTVKAKKVVSDNDEEDEGKAKPTLAPTSKSRPKQNMKFKSSEHVPTSDMEQDDPEPVSVAGPSTYKTSSKPPSSKAKPASSPRKSASIAKPTQPKQVAVEKKEDVEMDGAGIKSESELSVLVDEPPKPKRKAKSGEKEPKKPTKSRSKKETPALSKDEETIKRLKSFVVACGTRKVWSKVFQGLETPQQQIKKLKEILAELGMSGRLSMDQAKSIKAKRELDQELADVQEFASKMQGRSSRSQKGAASAAKAEVVSEESEDSEKDQASEGDDDEDVAPKRRPGNARKNILAFLDDQSDDE